MHHRWLMRVALSCSVAGMASDAPAWLFQSSRTLVAVLAHADDEGALAPVVARYAREGVQAYMVVVSDGRAASRQERQIPRPDVALTGDEFAAVRAEEARCAARELGMQPLILLGFPDGKLGDYVADPALVYRATERIAAELRRLRPDVVITWGPMEEPAILIIES